MMVKAEKGFPFIEFLTYCEDKICTFCIRPLLAMHGAQRRKKALITGAKISLSWPVVNMKMSFNSRARRLSNMNSDKSHKEKASKLPLVIQKYTMKNSLGFP